MYKQIYKLLLFTALATLLGSCVRDNYECPEPGPTRVLLAYVGTDNNLNGLEQEKIQGLRDGWTGNPNDRIIVYRDARGADARLMEISNLGPNEQPREIATYPNGGSGQTETAVAAAEMGNSASAATLARVIADVIGMFPDADSYGLLVFSHASGWLPQGALANPMLPAAGRPRADSRSVIVDGTQEMQLSDFAAAIPEGLFDYIVFETCFMAGIEVAYELRHKAEHILASSAEIVDPGFAPVYTSATAMLMEQDLAGFGQRVIDHTLTYAENSPQRSATCSVINTAGLEALAAFVKANCDLARAVDIADIQRFDRLSAATLFFDLGDYYSRLLDTEGQRSELSRLIANCIEWKAATAGFMNQASGNNGFAITKHSGLTAYIPQPALSGLNEAYALTQWARAVSPD